MNGICVALFFWGFGEFLFGLGFWGGLWIATLALLARNDGKGFEGGILGNLSF